MRNKLEHLIALARDAERLALQIEREISQRRKNAIDYNQRSSESTRPEAR